MLRPAQKIAEFLFIVFGTELRTNSGPCPIQQRPPPWKILLAVSLRVFQGHRANLSPNMTFPKLECTVSLVSNVKI